MQESSVEKFGAVHAKVQEGDNEQETTRGASLRELQRFFNEHDKDKGYAGLRRIADEDGTAVWTLLKETEVAAQLERRARERREEERRHEKIFSDQARSPSEAADAVHTLRAELEAARAELETAHGVAKAAQGDKYIQEQAARGLVWPTIAREDEKAAVPEVAPRARAETAAEATREVVPQVVATNDLQHQQITSQPSKIQDDLSELKRDAVKCSMCIIV